MRADTVQRGHELDRSLARARLFAWVRPMLALASRHWQITVGAGVAAWVGLKAVGMLPWPYFETSWWAFSHAVADNLVLTLVAVSAYRLLAEKESAGTDLEVNPWQQTIVTGLQVCAIWSVGGYVGAWVFMQIIEWTIQAVGATGLSGAALVVAAVYAVLALPIMFFLLSPVWVTLAVAVALSTAHAVRSLDNGLGAVLTSLQFAIEQRWRVFWPSYVLGFLILVGAVVSFIVQIRGGLAGTAFSAARLADVATFVSAGLAVALTFVIERAYAPELGRAFEEEEPDPRAAGAPAPGLPSGPVPAPRSPSGPVARPPSGAPRAGAATAQHTEAADAAAAPQALGALVEEALRTNRAQRLPELVERGLAADVGFFKAYPDSTVALAKRLAAAERADLALRLLQQFIKDHRDHRQHLTGALLAANLLARDPKRLTAAARFLEQLKAVYPSEPMVDQLIKSTHKALAAAGAGGAV